MHFNLDLSMLNKLHELSETKYTCRFQIEKTIFSLLSKNPNSIKFRIISFLNMTRFCKVHSKEYRPEESFQLS